MAGCGAEEGREIKMSKEGDIRDHCILAAADCGARVFRNNRGLFLTLDSKRRVRAGLECNGSADLIGWTKDGRFLAIELKSMTGKGTPAQDAFIAAVMAAGGVAFYARSPEEITKKLCSP